jgi:hypothetical protein
LSFSDTKDVNMRDAETPLWTTIPVSEMLELGTETLLMYARRYEERAMAGDRPGGPDRDRGNVNEPYEVRNGAEKFGISEDALTAGVTKIGPIIDDVAIELVRRL